MITLASFLNVLKT